MDYLEEIQVLLRQHGAVLARDKRHYIWRLPDGRIWVHPKTPSDVRAFKNNYHDLCKFLGVEITRKKNPCRKEKPGVARGRAVLGGVDVAVRDLRSQLKGLKTQPGAAAVQVGVCKTAMWLERFSCTPLWAVMRRVLKEQR